MSTGERNLVESFEVRGKWWLPDNEDNKLDGILSFKPDKRSLLKLSGGFRPAEAYGTGDVFEPEIILGKLNDGRLCTLLYNLEIQAMLGPVAPATACDSQFEVDYIFFGKHFYSGNDVRFSSVQVSYSYLEEWFAEIPFSVDIALENDRPRSVTAVCSQPEELFRVDLESLSCTITASHAVRFWQPGFRSLKWENEGIVSFHPTVESNFDWYWNTLVRWQQLLTLFVGEPVYPLRLTGAGVPIQLGGGKERREQIQIVFAQPRMEVGRSLKPSDMLVPLPLIRDNLETILQGWFDIAEPTESISTLLAGTFYHRGTFVHYHFLAITQALDSWHRGFAGGGVYLPADEYPNRVQFIYDAIPDALPADLRARLRSQIKYANEKSFRNRLLDLLNGLGPDSVQLLTTDPDYFVRKLVATRNYLTHHDEDLRAEALDGADVYYAFMKLRILLMIVLLTTLGVDETILVRSISGNKRLRHVFSGSNAI